MMTIPQMCSRTMSIATVMLLSVAASSIAADPEGIKAARTLFSKYVALEHAFDPAIADLYSDDALIRNKRTYPTGQVRELTLPAPQYKELLRKTMPLARGRGDTSEYSDCAYKPEARGVRIECQRYSNLKKYTSPISLLVGAGAQGQWLIIEELSESRP
jgi:hypothetical protein